MNASIKFLKILIGGKINPITRRKALPFLFYQKKIKIKNNPPHYPFHFISFHGVLTLDLASPSSLFLILVHFKFNWRNGNPKSTESYETLHRTCAYQKIFWSKGTNSFRPLFQFFPTFSVFNLLTLFFLPILFLGWYRCILMASQGR